MPKISGKNANGNGIGDFADFADVADAYELGCKIAILKFADFGSTNPLPESNRGEALPEPGSRSDSGQEDSAYLKSKKSTKSTKSPKPESRSDLGLSDFGRLREGKGLRGTRDVRG